MMCSACGAADANTQNARLSHRASAQVNQHQPLVRATTSFLTQTSVRYPVENGALF